MLRTGNKKLAAMTLLGDMLKGTVAVILCYHLLGGKGAAVLAGIRRLHRPHLPRLAEVQGRQGRCDLSRRADRPEILRSRVVFAAIWLSTAYLSRYSSLSALLASLLTPLLLWFWAGEKQMPRSPWRC